MYRSFIFTHVLLSRKKQQVIKKGPSNKKKMVLLKHFYPIGKAEKENFKNIVFDNKEELAAIIIEPLVQCAGGFKFHNDSTLKFISEMYQIFYHKKWMEMAKIKNHNLKVNTLRISRMFILI